jgi:hypothetical protein
MARPKDSILSARLTPNTRRLCANTKRGATARQVTFDGLEQEWHPQNLRPIDSHPFDTNESSRAARWEFCVPIWNCMNAGGLCVRARLRDFLTPTTSPRNTPFGWLVLGVWGGVAITDFIAVAYVMDTSHERVTTLPATLLMFWISGAVAGAVIGWVLDSLRKKASESRALRSWAASACRILDTPADSLPFPPTTAWVLLSRRGKVARVRIRRHGVNSRSSGRTSVAIRFRQRLCRFQGASQ